MSNKEYLDPYVLTIGFQGNRKPYLGFATYRNAVGNIVKEHSWETWRDKSIIPIEITNDFIEGFQLLFSVRRSSDWYGSGDRMWRVKDPRDFVLEITSDNLEYILSKYAVDKGHIVGTFKWVFVGNRIILIDRGNEDYLNGMIVINQGVGDSIIPKKEIKHGSKVILENGRQVLYYGSLPTVTHSKWRSNDKFEVKNCYVLIDEHGNLFTQSNPNIIKIVEEGTLDKKEVSSYLNSKITKVTNYYDSFFIKEDKDISYYFKDDFIFYKDYKWSTT